ncbi:MAG: LytTR family transcriptional regulator DNA-binding domain-containing protein [Paracoccaceae bacterium]|nr:LytTR family transcriptional regulator DNA-binding domain-containing protein [Paracoccaceae bacterium]
MAGFTGLSLTRGANQVPVVQRKFLIVMASVALGGGIWSMHFVAMLGLQLPILFFYDVLTTLISALVAILLVGSALLILHFTRRNRHSITLAGAIVGLGIALMHFIGMQGMEICRPVNSVADYAISTVASVVLSIVAITVAYDARTNRNIVLGTVCFGLSVAAVHYFAISQTGFAEVGGVGAIGQVMSNQTLALGVTVAAFMICGAFLLTSVTFLERRTLVSGSPPNADVKDTVPGKLSSRNAGVPYEREGRTFFAAKNEIAAIRAEGHYTLLYIGKEKLFCPWSVTEAESRLVSAGFVRVHRGYLVNPKFVSSFERLKDNGVLYFDGVESLSKVPVSRSKIAAVRAALGL